MLLHITNKQTYKPKKSTERNGKQKSPHSILFQPLIITKSEHMDLAERTCIDQKVEVARLSWLGILMNVT